MIPSADEHLQTRTPQLYAETFCKRTPPPAATHDYVQLNILSSHADFFTLVTFTLLFIAVPKCLNQLLHFLLQQDT